MKRKITLLFIPVIFAIGGCASNNLTKTVWYNLTMAQENGVMCNVGTSLVFNTDSTVVVYKGVSIDTTVIVSPYIYAYGGYQCQKIDGLDTKVTVSATKRDGSPFQYSGKYNKKNGRMVLNKPNSKIKETYVWNPKVKANSNNKTNKNENQN